MKEQQLLENDKLFQVPIQRQTLRYLCTKRLANLQLPVATIKQSVHTQYNMDSDIIYIAYNNNIIWQEDLILNFAHYVPEFGVCPVDGFLALVILSRTAAASRETDPLSEIRINNNYLQMDKLREKQCRTRYSFL